MTRQLGWPIPPSSIAATLLSQGCLVDADRNWMLGASVGTALCATAPCVDQLVHEIISQVVRDLVGQPTDRKIDDAIRSSPSQVTQ